MRAAEAQPPGAPPATDAAAAAAAEEPKEDGKDKPRKRVDWPRVGLAFVLVVVCVGGYLVALGLFLPDGFGGRDVDVRWDLVRRPDGPMPPLKYTPPRPTGVDDKWDILRLVGLLLGGICAVGSVGLLFSALVPREPEKKKEEKKEEKKSKKKKKR